MRLQTKELLLIASKLREDKPELFNSYLQGFTPIYDDLSRIYEVLDIFCQELNINRLDLIGSGRKPVETTYNRKLFIALIIKIYDPSLLTSPDGARLRKGVRSQIEKIFRMTPKTGLISDFVKDAVFSYNLKKGQYKRFSDKVDLVFDIITNNLNLAS